MTLASLDRKIWLAIAVVALLSGCGSRPPKLIGTWTYDSQLFLADEIRDAQTQDTFNLGGGYVSETKSLSPFKGGVSVTAKDTGTWKLEDDIKLTLEITDTRWHFSGGGDDARLSAEKWFEANKQTLLKRANSVNPVILEWNGDDAFSYRAGGKAFTERKKQGAAR